MSRIARVKDEPAKDVPAIPERVLALTFEEGSYCVTEFELPAGTLKKSGKKLWRSEPDQFAILAGHLQRKAREIFGI